MGSFESSVLSLLLSIWVIKERNILICFVSHLVIVGCFGDRGGILGNFGDWRLNLLGMLRKVRSDETTMEVTQSSQEGLPGLSGDASCVWVFRLMEGVKVHDIVPGYLLSGLAHN